MRRRSGNNGNEKRSALQNADQKRAAPPTPSSADVDSADENTGYLNDSRIAEGHDYNDEHEQESRENTEDREMTEAEFIRRLTEENSGTLLPKIPKKAGWRFCWAIQETSKVGSWRDYLRMGFKYATPADVPGFHYETISEGTLVGKIGHKELVLMKREERLHQFAMKHMHHDMPARMEGAVMDEVKNKLVHEDQGYITDVDSGMKKMGKAKIARPFE